MFDGLKNSIRSTKDTTKRASDDIIQMAKEVKDAPWHNLPPMGWAYIGFAVIMFILIIVFLVPLVTF